MNNRLTQTGLHRDANLRGRLVGIYVILIGATLAIWAWAFYTFLGSPLMLSTALLAYSFGLRHGITV